MFLRSHSPRNENLSHDVRNYVDSLKAIGLVSEKDGRLQVTMNTNPRVSDNIRAALISNDPQPGPSTMMRMVVEESSEPPAGGRQRRGSVNPTMVMPEAGTTMKRKPRKRSASRGKRGVKRAMSNASKAGDVKRRRGKGRGKGRGKK